MGRWILIAVVAALGATGIAYYSMSPDRGPVAPEQAVTEAVPAPTTRVTTKPPVIAPVTAEAPARERAGGREPVLSEQPGAPPEPQPREPISLSRGLISMNVEGQPLRELLHEIASLGAFRIQIDSGVEDRTVTASFDAWPLDQALLELARGLDVYLLYGDSPRRPVKGAWLFAGGQGYRAEPSAPESRAGLLELERQLADPDPQARIAALRSYTEVLPEEAARVALEQLWDRNDAVRVAALDTALKQGMPVDLEQLEELAGADPSPLVRFLALSGLLQKATHTELEGLRYLATSSLDDPDEGVSWAAGQILDAIDGAPAGADQEDADTRQDDDTP